MSDVYIARKCVYHRNVSSWEQLKDIQFTSDTCRSTKQNPYLVMTPILSKCVLLQSLTSGYLRICIQNKVQAHADPVFIHLLYESGDSPHPSRYW